MSAEAGREWYSDYFDERVVALHRARLGPARTRREVAAAIALLGLPVGARVLDVPCGWGRHALLMAGMGFEVTGMDLSRAALAEAAADAAEADVEVRWIRGEMRELEWEEEFDVVLNLGSSLGCFHSDGADMELLKRLRRALRPGGMLLLETMHRDGFLADFRALERWDDHPGEPVEIRREFDAVAGINHERTRWPDGTEKVHRMIVRSVTEWVLLLGKAGFAIEGLYGSWELEPVEHTSPTLVALGRRGE